MPLSPIRVRRMILQQFQNAIVSGIVGQGGRVFGEFTSDEFVGVPVPDRLTRLRERIREPLGPEAVYLGTIVPLAPGEKAF